MAPSSPSIGIVTSVDAASYSRSVPGVQLNALQTGKGVGPNVMRSVAFDDATLIDSSVGFPVRGQMTMSDDWIVVARISFAPPGTRWCGYDLEPGSTLLYAPGAEHTATSPAGVGYTAAIVLQRTIDEVANELHVRTQIPQRGGVDLLHPTVSQRSITSALGGVVAAAAGQGDPSTVLRNVIHALAAEQSEASRDHRPERMSVREHRRIVRLCFEFVNDAGGSPSIAELCRVACVSERRLRSAFVDAFGVPPMTYFRYQKLNEARNRLLATTNRQSVMDIALDVGIENGGRFARRYLEVFGELPSTTLQRTG